MDLTGEYRIPALRQDVWEALNNPEILNQCIDGCQELSKDSDTQFSAKVTAKVGPVKAKFSGKVTLSELDPPNGYKISGEGQGGVAGFAKGGATVKLDEDGGDTVLSYTANAEVGGKLASVGSRLVEGVAKKQADDFFGKFSQIVGGTSDEDSAETLANKTVSVEISPDNKPRGLSSVIWASGLIIVVAGILYFFVK
jgi:carbon monoxide dehydrogenase subunit G